jgi:hypothetical protein
MNCRQEGCIDSMQEKIMPVTGLTMAIGRMKGVWQEEYRQNGYVSDFATQNRLFTVILLHEKIGNILDMIVNWPSVQRLCIL